MRRIARKINFRLYGSVALATLVTVACGSDRAKKVTVGSKQSADGITQPGQASLALVKRDNQQPLQSPLKAARGDTFSLDIKLTGVSSNGFSYGYISDGGLNVTIAGTQLTVTSIPQGLHKLKVVARSTSDCEKLRKTNCRPAGQAVMAAQSFDLVKDYIINAIDPQTEYQKIQSTGGGIAGMMAREEGLIGILGKMFTGGQGLGGLFQNNAQPGNTMPPSNTLQQPPGATSPGY